MLLTLLPRVTRVSADAPWKAAFPMLVTLSGITTSVIEHLLKAYSPMLVTFSPIVTVVRALQ